MTERGLENNASPKAVISGDDFQLCFQPVLPQCCFELFLQNYAQPPINETLPYTFVEIMHTYTFTHTHHFF